MQTSPPTVVTQAHRAIHMLCSVLVCCCMLASSTRVSAATAYRTAVHDGKMVADAGSHHHENRGPAIPITSHTSSSQSLASRAHADDAPATTTMTPMLFMDLNDIASEPAPWGKLLPRANTLSPQPQFSPPACNWSGGDTVFAAFEVLDSPGTYEIFVAVGRPGEPYRQPLHTMQGPSGDGDTPGVKIQRYTTTDFKTWDGPTTVLFLPDGSGSQHLGFHPDDGDIWTAKSMDRNPQTGEYLMFASYGSSAHTFKAVRPTSANAFVPTTGSLEGGNFKDHDDCNVFFQQSTGEWVDMQIMYELYDAVGLDPAKIKKYCDNVSNDTRRVVSVRTSTDGTNWTKDWGCADAIQKDEHCSTFNVTALVGPCDCADDPPDLEFYRIRAFTLGASGRVAAHALNYVPSPRAVVYTPGYGRQPLWYCSEGCCHGPHSYEEWWIGPPSGLVTDMSAWRRSHKDTHAVSHDIWLMAQPVTTDTQHIWVDSGSVFALDLYRLAGIYSPGNGEFSTPVFDMPSTPMWVNADVAWYGGNYVGGADEGHQAYLMVALHQVTHSADGSVVSSRQVPGYEPEHCIITNTSGLQLPVVWDPPPSDPVAPGTSVQLRFFFRDATVYAVGAH
eukprot:m.73470 g.73470  ORF g.73470 m.73470 type:complete len:615 (-) comp8840_c0_seq1:262-2106(-)